MGFYRKEESDEFHEIVSRIRTAQTKLVEVNPNHCLLSDVTLESNGIRTTQGFDQKYIGGGTLYGAVCVYAAALERARNPKRQG